MDLALGRSIQDNSPMSWLSRLRRSTYYHQQSPYRAQVVLAETPQKDCSDVLKQLDVESGTGPYLLPARILKACYETLALPVLLLFHRILELGCWPNLWLDYWIVPMYT